MHHFQERAASGESTSPSIVLCEASSGHPQARFREVSVKLLGAQRVLLFGANGSGKSSLLESIAGLLPLERGTIEIGGRVSYCAHQSFLYGDLTVRENLRFVMSLLGEDKYYLQELVSFFELEPLLERRERDLSQGQRSRVMFVRSLLDREAGIFCFDEPTSALDDRMVDKFLSSVTQYLVGKIVIITSHDLLRLEAFGDRFWVMNQGELCLSTSEREVAKKTYHELNR